MEAKNSNRTRIIGLRLTPEEYTKIEKKWKVSDCRKLSDYVRSMLFEQPTVTTYRNRSVDDFMEEMGLLRTELNHIGNNFNQSVKRLHTLSEVEEFRRWQQVYDLQKRTFFSKVDEIKKQLQTIAGSWLQS